MARLSALTVWSDCMTFLREFWAMWNHTIIPHFGKQTRGVPVVNCHPSHHRFLLIQKKNQQKCHAPPFLQTYQKLFPPFLQTIQKFQRLSCQARNRFLHQKVTRFQIYLKNWLRPQTLKFRTVRTHKWCKSVDFKSAHVQVFCLVKIAIKPLCSPLNAVRSKQCYQKSLGYQFVCVLNYHSLLN